MSESVNLEQAVERIAKMRFQGIADEEVAAACGISIEQLLKLANTEAFDKAFASVSAESFDKFETLNQGWDVLENQALNRVLETMEHSVDPDFALRVAVHANKANRRGKHTNDPIQVQPGNQAVINVSVQFAQVLQQDFKVDTSKNIELKKKDDNFLPPKDVHALLGGVAASIKSEVKSIAAEFPMPHDMQPAV